MGSSREKPNDNSKVRKSVCCGAVGPPSCCLWHSVGLSSHRTAESGRLGRSLRTPSPPHSAHWLCSQCCISTVQVHLQEAPGCCCAVGLTTPQSFSSLLLLCPRPQGGYRVVLRASMSCFGELVSTAFKVRTRRLEKQWQVTPPQHSGRAVADSVGDKLRHELCIGVTSPTKHPCPCRPTW